MVTLVKSSSKQIKIFYAFSKSVQQIYVPFFLKKYSLK